jgi:hypothetical protein
MGHQRGGGSDASSALHASHGPPWCPAALVGQPRTHAATGCAPMPCGGGTESDIALHSAPVKASGCPRDVPSTTTPYVSTPWPLSGASRSAHANACYLFVQPPSCALFDPTLLCRPGSFSLKLSHTLMVLLLLTATRAAHRSFLALMPRRQ